MAPRKFCPFIQQDPWMGSKGQKSSEEGNVAYQINRKEVKNIMQAKFLTLYTPLPFWVG